MTYFRRSLYRVKTKLKFKTILIISYYSNTIDWHKKTNIYTHISSSSIKTYVLLPPTQLVPFQMWFSLHWHCSWTQTSFLIHWCVISHEELIVSPSKTEFMKGCVKFERKRGAKVLWKCFGHYDLIGSVLSL